MAKTEYQQLRDFLRQEVYIEGLQDDESIDRFMNLLDNYIQNKIDQSKLDYYPYEGS